MVVGFNHNFRYKGEVYHVQTEDSGVKTPHIITLLYKGGTILASKKTSYSDIIRVDNLEQVVEELMKEQHRDMLRRLKDGEFDHLLGLAAAPTPPVAQSSPIVAPAAAIPVPSPAVSTGVVAPPSRPAVSAPPVAPSPSINAPVASPPPLPRPAVPPPPPPPKPAERIESPLEASLDEIILSYMVGDERKGNR